MAASVVKLFAGDTLGQGYKALLSQFVEKARPRPSMGCAHKTNLILDDIVASVAGYISKRAKFR